MLAPQIQAVALEIQMTLLDCSGTSAQKMRSSLYGSVPSEWFCNVAWATCLHRRFPEDASIRHNTGGRTR
ncbi:hypothetical protein HPB47_012344, partial [Ixodes persulcatus]